MVVNDSNESGSPLLTNGFLLKMTAAIGVMAALTALLTVAGQYYGEKIAMDDHTTDRTIQTISVGQDVLSLPANMIRFDNQRRSGRAETVDLYLSWPELDGFTPQSSQRFSDPAGAQDLLFVDFSQSVMSRDMSGRLAPIYSRLFRGEPETGPAGLVLHHLDPKSGFGDEVVLTGMTSSGGLYVVRCLLPTSAEAATTADCQRDVHVGHDLTLLYRFSSRLLPQWESLDARLSTFAMQHIAR